MVEPLLELPWYFKERKKYSVCPRAISPQGSLCQSATMSVWMSARTPVPPGTLTLSYSKDPVCQGEAAHLGQGTSLQGEATRLLRSANEV